MIIVVIGICNYSAMVGVQSIVINLSVCVSVSPRAYLHEILCVDSLWLWLGRPLAALHYVLSVLWMMSRLAVIGVMSDVYECFL